MKVIKKIFKLFFQIYIAILSAIPTEIGKKLRYIAYKPLFKKVNGKFSIDTGVTILGFENITLGNNISFQKNSYIYANDGGNLIIGNDFFLGTNSQLSAVRGDIRVGNNVLIAPNCILRPDDHKFIDKNQLIINQGYNIGQIIIKDDVWIASNSVILRDVTLAIGCVVAAGSIVNKNVNEYTVVGGVPAKLIKERGDESND